jgi:hypothetical protein
MITMIRLMTLDSAVVIPQALWAEEYSTAIHIKNCLPYSTFKLKILPYKIIFGDKPLINQLYSIGSKYYVYLPKEKPIRTSKLSP